MSRDRLQPAQAIRLAQAESRWLENCTVRLRLRIPSGNSDRIGLLPRAAAGKESNR